jgi:hypothetical protein
MVMDVTTGAWEVDDCECRGGGVAVLVIEVGEEPGYVALQGVTALGRRNSGAKVSRNSTISGSGSVEALGTALGMIGLWSMPTTMPHY